MNCCCSFVFVVVVLLLHVFVVIVVVIQRNLPLLVSVSGIGYSLQTCIGISSIGHHPYDCCHLYDNHHLQDSHHAYDGHQINCSDMSSATLVWVPNLFKYLGCHELLRSGSIVKALLNIAVVSKEILKTIFFYTPCITVGTLFSQEKMRNVCEEF